MKYSGLGLPASAVQAVIVKEPGMSAAVTEQLAKASQFFTRLRAVSQDTEVLHHWKVAA